MDTPVIVLISVIAALVVIAVPVIIMIKITMPIAKKVCRDTLVKTAPDKWGRVCSAPDNEEQLAMWQSGIKWAESNKQYIKEISIINDGLKLVGEYFDYGCDRCVIIIPGRCECLMYSYYYAQTYEKVTNILVFDSRSHGYSQGDRSYLGFKENEDLLKWAEYAHDVLGNKEIYFHGICIGAATAVQAITLPHAPKYITKFITDGCYTTFYETFKNHMIYDNRPVHPVIDEIRHILKKEIGVDMKKQGPIYLMDKVTIPTLFISTTQDKFSLPEKTKELYEKCGSAEKKLVWFDKGAHSHIRINNEEEYTSTILDFIG